MPKVSEFAHTSVAAGTKIPVVGEHHVLVSDIAGLMFTKGSGSPVGVVTPNFEGQFYRDVVENTLWQATGNTFSDWIQWI